MPYVRRPRSNALKIVNPDTMEEINAASAASAAIKPSASTATSEGSPAPSEVSLFLKVFLAQTFYFSLIFFTSDNSFQGTSN